MSAESSSKGRQESHPARERLLELRHALLDLHKILIDSERVGYEKTFGTIGSPADFLQLLIRDPWFAWLHPVSEMIVLIDEILDGEEPVTGEITATLVKNARALLTPAEQGEGFANHYFEALQRDPDVVLGHAKPLKLLSALQTELERKKSQA